jgi:hypothetical protein
MSVGMQVALLAFGGVGIWTMSRYYWLRVLACFVLLVVWGIVGIGGPLFVAIETLQGGQVDKALLTLIVFVITGGLWYIAFLQAREWLRRTRKAGFFRKRWNAR